jgi:hypothetical protein
MGLCPFQCHVRGTPRSGRFSNAARFRMIESVIGKNEQVRLLGVDPRPFQDPPGKNWETEAGS